MKRALMIVVTSLCCSGLVLAEQSLEQAASDPTAALMNVQIGDWYNDYHNLSGESANQVNLRTAIPFKIGEQQHIMRATIPVVTDSPFLDSGVSDITVFDLMTFSKNWGRWGAGIVGLLPTGGADRGADKWGLGPAIGFSAHEPGFLWGVFNQNILTVAGDNDREDVNVSVIQPIVNKSLGNGWSTGASEMNITYDWEQNKWSNLPLGIKLAKMHKFGKLPVQFNAQYEYNFADDDLGSPKQTLRLTAKFIFPSIL